MEHPPTNFLTDFSTLMGLSNIILCSLQRTPMQSDGLINSYFDTTKSINLNEITIAIRGCSNQPIFEHKSMVWALNIEPGWTFGSGTIYLLPNSLASKVEDLPLRLNSQLFTYAIDGSLLNDTITITEWYKVNGHLFTNKLASWTQNSGLSLLSSPNIWTRRGNLRGITLRNTIVPHWRNNIVPSPYSGQELTGKIAEAAKVIAQALNFTIEWVIKSPGDWGTFKNDTWSGIIGDLAYDRASFTSTSLWYYPSRAKVVDYGLGVFEDDITVGLSSKYGITTKKLDTAAYLMVFKGVVWLFLLSLCLLSGLVFNLSTKYSVIDSDRSQLDSWYWRFTYGLVDYLATLGDRTFVRPKDKSFERIMFFIQLCSMMMFAVYSCALTAHVTSKETMIKPKSFQEMLDLGITAVLPQENIRQPMFALAKPGSAADQIYQSAIFVPPSPGNTVASVAEQVEVRDQDPNHRANILYSNSRNEHTITLRHFQERVPNALTMGFKKDSELKPLFDYQVIKMHNSGLLDKIASDYLPDQQTEDASSDFNDNLSPMGMDGLYLPLALIGIGAILGACLLIMEVGERCIVPWFSRKVMKLPYQEKSPSPHIIMSTFTWLTATTGLVDGNGRGGVLAWNKQEKETKNPH